MHYAQQELHKACSYILNLTEIQKKTTTLTFSDYKLINVKAQM
jgi:hypothetical protein